jgi:hypothetical protein
MTAEFIHSSTLVAGSAGSGSTSVSLNSGRLISVFEPTGDSVPREAEGAGEPA